MQRLRLEILSEAEPVAVQVPHLEVAAPVLLIARLLFQLHAPGTELFRQLVGLPVDPDVGIPGRPFGVVQRAFG